MIRRVTVSADLLGRAEARFGLERSVGGDPSVYEFVNGPLAAALFAFKEFDELPMGPVPAVRTYIVVDPIFGPVVFVGLLMADDSVELVDFEPDPDYGWSLDDDGW